VARNFFTSCKIEYSGKALRYGAGAEVVTVVITNNAVTPYDLVDSYRRFSWTYYLPVRRSRSQTLNDNSLQRSVWFVYTAEVSPFSSIQTLNDWSSSYVPEGPQGESEWRIYVIKCAPVYTYTRHFSLNPNSSTLEYDRPQHDCPAACVIAQEYSSSACSLIELFLSQKKSARVFKRLLFKFLNFFYCVSVFPEHGDVFLGAFAKLQKAAIRSVMSVRPSFLPHGTTGLPLDGHLWNFIFEYFSKICHTIYKFN
jgi:hypothetical protein